MLAMIRDLPFIDTIFPALVALGLWCGVHILYIGPEIVGPRLADKYYFPACQAGVKAARAQVENARKAAQAARRAQAERAGDIAGQAIDGLTRSIFGDDYMRAYGDLPVFQGMRDIARLGAEMEMVKQPAPTETPATHSNLTDYCGCIIAAHLGERLSTGLFSASMRLWKPATIVQLERLERELIRSDHCGHPVP